MNSPSSATRSSSSCRRASGDGAVVSGRSSSTQRRGRRVAGLLAVAADELVGEVVELGEQLPALGGHLAPRRRRGRRRGRRARRRRAPRGGRSRARRTAGRARPSGVLAEVVGGAGRRSEPASRRSPRTWRSSSVSSAASPGRAGGPARPGRGRRGPGRRAHVRHGVVEVLQLPPPGPELVELEGVDVARHHVTARHRREDGDLVGGADGRRVGGGIAVDPDPARREHVGEVRAVALAGGAEHVADRRPGTSSARCRRPPGPTRTCARSPRRRAYPRRSDPGPWRAGRSGRTGPVSVHVLCVRHGLSTWNLDRRWQGRADPPLSDEGRPAPPRWPRRSAPRSAPAPARGVVVPAAAGGGDGGRDRRAPRRRAGRPSTRGCGRPTSGRGRG